MDRVMTAPLSFRLHSAPDPTDFLNFVTDFGAVADGVIDPVTGQMTGTDNNGALSDWIDYGISQGNTQVKLLVPAGNYHLAGNVSFVSRNSEATGIKDSIVSAYGAVFDNLFIGPLGTLINDFAHTARIASVSAGATSVTVISAGCKPDTDVSLFSAGDWVCVCGLGLQTGYPPNFQWFEFREVASVSGQTVHFTEALDNDYLDTWPDIDTKSVTVTSASPAVFTLNNHGLSTNQFIYVDMAVGGSVPTGITRNQEYRLASPTTNTFQLTLGGSPVNTSSTGSSVKIHTSNDAGGPATIILLKPTFNCTHVMQGASCSLTGNLTSVGGRHTTVTGCSCQFGFSPSIGRDILIEESQTGLQNEVDKLVTNLTYRNCHSDIPPGNLQFFSTSIENFTLDHSNLNVIGTPKHTTIIASDIAIMGVGGNAYGHSVSLTATDSNFTTAANTNRSVPLSIMSFSAGTFSCPKVTAELLYATFVPGEKCAFGHYAGGFIYHRDSDNAILSFTVTAVRESSDVIFVDTDWGSSIPTDHYAGVQCDLVGNIPFDTVTLTTCTGADLTVYDDFT